MGGRGKLESSAAHSPLCCTTPRGEGKLRKCRACGRPTHHKCPKCEFTTCCACSSCATGECWECYKKGVVEVGEVGEGEGKEKEK